MTSRSSGAEATNAARPSLWRSSFWKGRIVPLLGIVLLGIGLRYAVTGHSPLLTTVTSALGISAAGATFIGMLPIISFGLGGFAAHDHGRRFGQEGTALAARRIRPLMGRAPAPEHR